jgi:hypothetical protein
MFLQKPLLARPQRVLASPSVRRCCRPHTNLPFETLACKLVKGCRPPHRCCQHISHNRRLLSNSIAPLIGQHNPASFPLRAMFTAQQIWTVILYKRSAPRFTTAEILSQCRSTIHCNPAHWHNIADLQNTPCPTAHNTLTILLTWSALEAVPTHCGIQIHGLTYSHT